MKDQQTIPELLFKYRGFSARTIELLVADQLYFAAPSTFNDPLDSKPCVEADLPESELMDLLSQLVEKRFTDKMEAAAKTLKYRGSKTYAHIGKHSTREAQETIELLKYLAANPDGPKVSLAKLLTDRIETELQLQYDKGILALAERNDCPLMWSHYGDQHQGLCIGYSVSEFAQEDLYKVQYGGTRLVAASKIAAMLDGDKNAQREVDEAVLLRKAAAWQYEKEWRLIGNKGQTISTLELVEITFGMRCPITVMHAITKALEKRDTPVKLYTMLVEHGTFNLRREPLDIDEITSMYPHRALSTIEAFADIWSPEK